MTHSYRRPHDSPTCPCSGCEAFDRKLTVETDRCGCCGQPAGAPHITLGGSEVGFKRCPNDPDQSDPNIGASCDPTAVAEDDGWRPSEDFPRDIGLGDEEALELANAMTLAAELNLLEDWPGADVR